MRLTLKTVLNAPSPDASEQMSIQLLRADRELTERLRHLEVVHAYFFNKTINLMYVKKEIEPNVSLELKPKINLKKE